MALGKNIIYNSVLTVSNYLIPLIVFPYISRTLGVEGLGKASFVESIINFVLLFSMFGIYNLGVREIAKSKNDPQALNNTYSSLFALNTINTFIVFFIFIVAINFIPRFSEYKQILYLGSFNIIFNLFLIQWLFVGIEQFKFIVLRTIILRLLYVIAIFLFIKKPEDYAIYYILSVALVFFNALVNYIYSKKVVKFTFKGLSLKRFLGPYLFLGLYSILTSLYTTFNMTFLGLVADEREIGYYTTAVKVQSIFLALFTAISTAIVPHMSSLVGANKQAEIRSVVNNTVGVVFSLGIPIVYCSMVLAPQIIFILSGPGFSGAILPLQIVMPTLLLIALAQIVILQILMPFGNDKIILINTIIGAVVGLALNFALVKSFGASGAGMVWLVSEIVVYLLGHFVVMKKYKINTMSLLLLKHILWGGPYLIICFCLSLLPFSAFIILFLSLVCCLIYFCILQFTIYKDGLIAQISKRIIHKIFNYV